MQILRDNQKLSFYFTKLLKRYIRLHIIINLTHILYRVLEKD